MIKYWQFIQNSGDFIFFGIILLVVLVLFIKDFQLTSVRSWLILAGITAMGAVMAIRAFKKNKLLSALAEREEALKKLEEEYEKLKDEHKISKENYENTKKELDEAKKKTARDILKADEKYNDELKKIDEEYKDINPSDLITRSRTILNQ